MININTTIHDKYSIEFKVGFMSEVGQKFDDFDMAMWIFIPGSLDINASTYPKSAFYQDVKSNIRLITPSYGLNDICGGKAEPLSILRSSIAELSDNSSEETIKEYEYHLKMFAAIVKSSLRGNFAAASAPENASRLKDSLNNYITGVTSIFDEFHALRPMLVADNLPKKHFDSYRYADEFICYHLCKHSFKMIAHIEDSGLESFSEEINLLKDFIRKVDRYRVELEYPIIVPDDPANNNIFIHRQSSIKKFIERQLYLRAPKKKDGAIAEQVYYSLAAGLAMIFATVVGWAFQSTFGNLTWPLFVALIISYMMKDRIKELTRFYFANNRVSKYFDNKAKILMHGKEIGLLKEVMNFARYDTIPEDVIEKRNASPLVGADRRIGEDKVILYRKEIHLDRDIMNSGEKYEFPGINDILRFQVNSLLHKMDNPTVHTKALMPDGTIKDVPCEKNYYVNILLKYECDHIADYKRFRITLTRNGISAIDPIEV